MKSLSQIVASTPASGIRRFFDLVAELDDVISLGVGEPDYVTPWRIREAAIYSLEKGRTTYTSNYGLLELREAIVAKHIERYGTGWNPRTEVLVTVGVSEALDTAFRAILNPGDEVLIPEPCYVSYAPCVMFAGGVPVPVPTRAKDGFAAHPEAITERITEKTKAILLSYPTNPTGAVMSREGLQRVVDIAVANDLYILSDEIYDRLCYDSEHVSVPALRGAKERTILLNGFSKAYAMTGWRIGYACAPAPIIEMMMKIHQYTMLCAPITAQIAAIEALKNAEQDTAEMVADYDRRRRLFVKGLNDLGLECRMPGGAFYAFPSIEKTGLTSEEFAERLLREERVLVVPGDVFGNGGIGHVRCCYATATSKLTEALERMGRFLGRLGTMGA
ncbi:aminotransferase class I/II-fold pyridoxal phosphate-dependent enzyme [Armatimonas sp.]|uniref:aminotransferase class I/II-fold pyridoxal phosphate-dependent enzyme n=1 Tax=Armatimonas sp. TaxID=1872638 RepID=UPI003753A932